MMNSFQNPIKQNQNRWAHFLSVGQKTGLSAPIPRKPLRGLLRDFRFNPLRVGGGAP
jgi:hypothetical protein